MRMLFRNRLQTALSGAFNIHLAALLSARSVSVTLRISVLSAYLERTYSPLLCERQDFRGEVV